MENILAVVNLYVLLTLHHVQKTSIQFFQIYIKNHKIRGPSVKVLGIASENKSDDALNWREEEEEQVFGNQSRHKTSTAKSCFELYMFWPKNNIFLHFHQKISVQKSKYYFLVYFWTKCLPMSKRFRIWWAILICTDLGSLIGNTLCENFRIFSATQILREIRLEEKLLNFHNQNSQLFRLTKSALCWKK